jgi:hypothetical protein
MLCGLLVDLLHFILLILLTQHITELQIIT